MDYPHAPWWQPSDESSVTQTAANAAALHASASATPGSTARTSSCSRGIAELDLAASARTSASATTCCFGVALPRRPPRRRPRRGGARRARADARRVADARARRRRPDAARPLPAAGLAQPPPVRPATIERTSTRSSAAQQDDGGWTRRRGPTGTRRPRVEWRGVVTVNALTPAPCERQGVKTPRPVRSMRRVFGQARPHASHHRDWPASPWRPCSPPRRPRPSPAAPRLSSPAWHSCLTASSRALEDGDDAAPHDGAAAARDPLRGRLPERRRPPHGRDPHRRRRASSSARASPAAAATASPATTSSCGPTSTSPRGTVAPEPLDAASPTTSPRPRSSSKA